MRFLYDTYEDIADCIKKEDKYIVVYGAGMIGSVWIPYFIQEYQLYDNFLFYIDQDKRKQCGTISIGDRQYEVKCLEYLRKIPENAVVLVTNSNFSPIVKMLDKIEELQNVEGYIIPVLQVLHTHYNKQNFDLKLNTKQLIPKKIHYCWFSHNPMPEYLQKCIESWHKFCPDYEIIKWDEDNYDIEKNVYTKQAYEQGKWGFVPDIVRLDILYRYGGIYLDTDVELTKNLDVLLQFPAFVGVEKWGNINMGGCSGAIAQHPVVKALLDYRINEPFILENGTLNQTTCGYYETLPLMKLGMKPDNTIQNIENMMIFSSDFFHPYDYMSGELNVTENTFSIHHFNGGWLDTKKIEERKQTTQQYAQILKRMKVEKCE